MNYLKKISFLLIIGVALSATSCVTCMCQDNNTGYIYPDTECDCWSINCCRKVQKEMNKEGKSVTCIKMP